MSYRLRPYKGNKKTWEVDIVVEFPDGTTLRQRRKSPVSSKSGTVRWARQREKELYDDGPPETRKKPPTLKEFTETFLHDHAIANRHKPSGIAAKETIIRVHLVPLLGAKRLDEISNRDVQQLKGQLSSKANKTVNNVLSTLSTLLKKAVEWGLIERVPCKIRLLRVEDKEAEFLDFHEYESLIDVAKRIGVEEHLAILLGGEAGLRCGEIMALEWSDLDFSKRQIRVQRSEWKGQVTVPKGGKTRIVPMTARLAQALQAHRNLVSARVLTRTDGSSVSQKVVRGYVLRASRLAQIRCKGPHTLRHTFCSHLAMRGAPAPAIQELAGHKDLTTTMRYMHLSPRAIEDAIRLLEQRSEDDEQPADDAETA